MSSDIINGIFQTYCIRNLLGKEVEKHNLESHLKETELIKFKKVQWFGVNVLLKLHKDWVQPVPMGRDGKDGWHIRARKLKTPGFYLRTLKNKWCLSVRLKFCLFVVKLCKTWLTDLILIAIVFAVARRGACLGLCLYTTLVSGYYLFAFIGKRENRLWWNFVRSIDAREVLKLWTVIHFW